MRFDLIADLQPTESPSLCVGMGHARRCIALAEALRKQEKEISVRVFFPDAVMAKTLFPAWQTIASWEELWQEETRENPEREDCAMLIVDSYRLSSLPARLLGRYREVACFHDDKPPPSFATIAICCDLATKTCDRSLSRQSSPSSSPRLFFGGGRYFPFHDRFGERKAHEQEAKNRLLVWLGGRDRGERLVPLLTKEVLGAWLAEVVISPVVKPCPKLRDLAHEEAPVRIHNDSMAMDALMPRCALYLGSAGVAACEAALLGLKLVLCVVAENQLGNARALESAGAILLQAPLTANALRATLKATERQPPLDLASLGLDRNGARRLAKSLVQSLSLREGREA